MIKKNYFYLVIMIFCFLQLSSAQAVLVQILHTNDTHSYLDYSTHDRSSGGAARLKSLIDSYKNKMSEQNIKTITMDAGDFMEGNIFYMAQEGKKVFEVHNEMGYDVVALGNHDYLMGTLDFDKILGSVEMKTSLLAANLKIAANYNNIHLKISPYKEIEIDGLKIAILGLTTDEIYYKWRLEGGVIRNPIKTAQDYEDILKNRKNDFIIALTHLGVLRDIELAEKTKKIDLIVGGHSHSALFRPSYGINKNKRAVPIVQAGMNTEYLGRLILDLEKGKALKIVSYELIPVKNESTDAAMVTRVQEANDDLEKTYGKEWLDEKVSYSNLKANDQDGSLKWAYFIADSIKEKTRADIAIHTPSMNGENFPVGNVSRRDLFNSMPRVFDLTEKYGWSIYTTQIKGFWLRALFEVLNHLNEPVLFSGMTVGSNTIMINGEAVRDSQYYTVAFTEGIIKGIQGIQGTLPFGLSMLKNATDTTQKIWMTLEENFIKNIKRIDLNEVLKDKNHMFHRSLAKRNEDPFERISKTSEKEARKQLNASLF